MRVCRAVTWYLTVPFDGRRAVVEMGAGPGIGLRFLCTADISSLTRKISRLLAKVALWICECPLLQPRRKEVSHLRVLDDRIVARCLCSRATVAGIVSVAL